MRPVNVAAALELTISSYVYDIGTGGLPVSGGCYIWLILRRIVKLV